VSVSRRYPGRISPSALRTATQRSLTGVPGGRGPSPSPTWRETTSPAMMSPRATVLEVRGRATRTSRTLPAGTISTGFPLPVRSAVSLNNTAAPPSTTTALRMAAGFRRNFLDMVSSRPGAARADSMRDATWPGLYLARNKGVVTQGREALRPLVCKSDVGV
jgi:hypothetical protein